MHVSHRHLFLCITISVTLFSLPEETKKTKQKSRSRASPSETARSFVFSTRIASLDGPRTPRRVVHGVVHTAETPAEYSKPMELSCRRYM